MMRLLPLLAPCLLASGAPTGKVATATVRVAVVGAGGYIGSRLHEHLERRGFAVTGYDRSTRLIASAGSLTFRAPVSAGQLLDRELHAFDVVIFLGGLTGRVACDTAQSAAKVHKENVEEPVNLAKRMRPHQLLIFASTSAIAEGSGDVPMRENGTVQTVLLDSYSASMYARERAMASLASGASSAAASLPQLVGLRFGTVIGVSRGQRTDLGPMALLWSAFTSGVLHVAHPETHRAFLWLEDLVEGFASLIQRARGVGTGATRYTRRFGIFNLLSFNSNVAALAAAVAARTGTRIDTLEHRPAKDSVGFTLDGAAFGQAFGFTPKGDLAAAVNDLVAHAPNSISAKGVLVSRKRLFSDYLYVSGTSATLQKHFEWLATHIAAAVERERPLHGGGGRREEGASSYRSRTVLELACNDGSQLDAFKRLGWRTYGVDPAANIVPTAVAKGHHVKVGFWGAQNVWPPADEPAIELDAIVAQNVLAHVPSPVNFLRDCAKAMGRHTLLYIQTSQCHMHEEGQFDTAYHEHLSFFTAHSFRKAADLAGLNVTGWQVVPIHGQSCLVTFKKLHHVNGGGGQSSSSDALHLALQPRLQEEAQLGLLDDLFYEKYQARAGVTASWIEKQLEQLRVAGYRLGGYGAAAKGMVLLHFLLGRGKAASHLEFVVDDAPMKQGTYCPGTTIPVKPLAHVSSILADDPHTPLALVVFAWNFWPEIALRLQASLKSNRRIIAILPFPTPHVVTLNGRVLSNMSYHTAELGDALQLGVPLEAAAAVAPVAPGSIAPRRRTMLISHFYNEAMLLPFWIAHHAPLFDHAILIDCNSTDGSAELVRKLAPPSWTVIPLSTVSQFGARTLDAQVEQQERLFPNDWHLALTVTEFLIHPRFRETLATFDAGLAKAKHDKAYPKIRALPVLPTVGDDTRSPLRRFESLPIQRSMYLWEKAWNPRTFARHINGGNPPWRRYMHTGEIKGAIYEAGRHGITPAYSSRIVPHMDGFVMKYTASPWPESMMRHMQTGHNISEDDRKQGLGNQHLNGMDYTKLNGNHISPLHSQDIRVHDLREVLDPSDRAPPEMVKWHSLFREHLDPPHPLFPPALTKTKRDVNVMEGHHHTSPTNFREAFVPYSVSIEPQPPVVSGRDHNHNHHRDWPRATAARDHTTDMAAANSEAVPAGGREALPGEAAEGDAAALARGRQWGLLYVLGACALLPLSVSISLFCRRLGIVYTRLPPPQTKTTSEATSVTAKAEGRVEGDSSSRLARFLFAAGVVCTFICLNSALSILNRWALGVAGGLHIPLLMTASHMIFGAFALAPLMILHDGYARTLLAEARSRARALVLIALMNALQIGLNNASLVCIELSLNQVVRAIGPVVTSALLVCLEGKVPDHREAVCLLLISGGAATTVYSGFGSSTAVGVGLTASSTLAQCLQISISGRIMQGRGQQLGKLDAFQMTALTGPLAFVALLPFALYYEFGVFSAALAMQRARVLGFLLGSCLLAVAYNVTLFQALATLSTIGASILGNVKIVLLLLLSALILGELRTWSVVQLVGCTLTFVASGWYSWHVATKRTE